MNKTISPRREAILSVLITITISIIFVPIVSAQFKVNKIEMSSMLELEEEAFSYHPAVHYNRVEGLHLGMGISVTPYFLPDIKLIAEGGYGISNKQWRYKLDLHKDFFEFNKLRIGAQAFYLTSSLDDWYIGQIENSLAALFFKEDFMNYFAKKGFMVFINKIFLDSQVQLRVEAANYDYRSMERTTQWAIFGKGKKFRGNPEVEEGNETSIKFILSYDGRDNPLFPISGWLIDGIYEHTTVDFKTDGFFLTIKRFQPTFGAQRLRMRAMLGMRQGSFAEQHTMDLGGIGTLPGFKDKEFQNGNHLLLFNFEYLFNGDILRNIPLSFLPLYDALALSLFSDIGWLHLEENENFYSFKGFKKVQLSQLKTDVGFSFSVSEGIFLINFAKRTDRSNDAWRITCRLMYKF